MDFWKDPDKEKIIRCFTSLVWAKIDSKPRGSNSSNQTMHKYSSGRSDHGKADTSFEQRSMTTANTSSGPTERRDHRLEGTATAIPIASQPWKGDISRPALYIEDNTVSEQDNNWGIVQGHANGKSPYFPDPSPDDRRPISDQYQIDPTKSIDTTVSLPLLQPDTVCGLCGSLQASYKPSPGVVLCDICSSQYQLNDLTALGLGLGEYRSTDQSFHPASELDTSHQGDSTNHASWPDVTTSSGYGNDIDDFSWFMAS